MAFTYDADVLVSLADLEAASPATFANGAHVSQFSAHLNDVATAANGVKDAADYVDTQADAAAASATAASGYADKMGTVSTTSLAIGAGSKTFTIASESMFREIGRWVRAQSDASPIANAMRFQITSSTATTVTGTVAAEDVFGSGTHTDWTLLITEEPGDTGATGATGASGRRAGFPMVYNATYTATDPTTAHLQPNNATPASISALYISEVDSDGKGINKAIKWAAETTSTIKGNIRIEDAANPNNFLSLDVIGPYTDNGGWDTIGVQYRDHGGTLADATAVLVLPSRSGDKGDDGDQGGTGATGATGATGPTTTHEFDWDTGVTDADRGAGKIGANNATYASITRLYVDNLNRAGGDAATWVDSWDDSTNSDRRGDVIIKVVDDPDTYLHVYVSGIVNDQTGYRRVVVTYVGHYGTLSGRCSVQFDRTGNAGLDGAGAGNVNSTGTIVAGHFAIYSDTTGNLLQDGGAFTAATIPNVAAGSISSTNVQAAINELDTEKAPLASPSFTGMPEIAQAIAFTGDISPTQITADQNNYAPTGFSTCSIMRLDLDAARALTGLAGGSDGRRVTIFNISAFTLTLTDASSSSSAANRFDFGGDAIIKSKGGVVLIYDSTSSRWRAERSNSAPEIPFTPTGGIAATNVATALAELDSEKATIASPTFTGTPAAPTATAGTNTTQIATTAFTIAEILARLASNDAELYKGAIDASSNPNYPAADAGHTYRISVAGKIGGASGPNVQVGDRIVCNVDSTASGNHATVGANWDILQVNIDGAVVGPTSAVDNIIAVFDGTTGALIKQGSSTIANVLARANHTGSQLASTISDFTEATQDVMGAILADSADIDWTYTDGSDTLSAVLTTAAKPYGKQAIWIPANAMVARTTNGAASGTLEMTTNKNMFSTLDFDTSTQEFAQFSIRMPKSWNEDTVTYAPVWSHAATTTNFGVVFSLAGVACSNDDAGDVAFGTVQTSTDTGGTTNDIYEGPESSAITIAGSPAANDYVMFQVARVPADGSDTMAIDARLHGIILFITTDAGNDA